MFDHIHQSPNRIRLQTNKVNRKSPLIPGVVETIKSLHGVQHAFYREVTGSLIVLYQSEYIWPSTIINTLNARGYLPRLTALPLPFARPISSSSIELPIKELVHALMISFINHSSKNITDMLLTNAGRIIFKKIIS